MDTQAYHGAATRRPRRGITVGIAVAAGILVAGGATGIGLGVASQQSPPTPGPAAHSPRQTAGSSHEEQQPLSRSKPVSLSIPEIAVHHKLVTLGLNPDHTVEVPPLSKVDVPGWYKYSPTPGERGPAVILGHVDSAKQGEGVFFRLADMKPGQHVSVDRADGSTAVFTVDKVKQYPKSDFPTEAVYGTTPNPQLRLITCGGAFDEQEHSYADNTVVYAHLTGSR